MVLIFKKGENFLEALKKRLAEKEIKSGFFYGLGGFNRATLAYYDLKKKKYITRKMKSGPYEVVSLMGNVASDVTVHCHAVLGKRDFHTVGGHLMDAVVGGTLELLLMPTEPLQRRKDEKTGLNLLG